MIEIISNQAKKMMFECCERYAKSKNIPLSDVQLLLGIDEEGNTYKICENYQPKVKYDIMQVLGVKIDFLGYSQIAPPFILKSLVRLSEEHGIELNKISVMCIPQIEYYTNKKGKEKSKNEIEMFLFNGGNCVETKYIKTIEDNDGNIIEIEKNGISFDELFNQEDIELPT